MAIVEKGGKYYILDQIWKCSVCGSFVREPYTHYAKIYEDRYYHLNCLREIHKKAPRESMTPEHRVQRLMNRLSKNRIISPKEIEEIASKICKNLGGSWKKALPRDHLVGYYKGTPLVEDLEYLNGADLWDAEEKRSLLLSFWQSAERKKFKPAELELAVLLTLLGDKHGITHATSKRAGVVRRSKATHPRNHPEHP